MARDRGAAAVREDEGGQDLDERRLARAVRAEQAEDAAAADLEIEPVEGGHGAPVEGMEDKVPEAPEDGIPLDQALGDEDGRDAHPLSIIRRAAVTAGLRRRSTYRP